MTSNTLDGMIRPKSTTNKMAIRPKIQIDTPNTNSAIAELAKRLATIKGMSQREYMLAALYNGAENESMKMIILQELGPNSKHILDKYKSDGGDALRRLLGV